MGKSPGKWIKTVFLGKKSSKSNLSKVATLDKETSIAINTKVKDLDADPTVISSPVGPVINSSKEHTQLEQSTPENARSTIGLDAANDDELIKLDQPATKAETAFRGCLEYFDTRNEEGNLLELTKAKITGVEMTGMGDRVCVDLCSLMRPGEGLLVGCFARGLFLVHSECLESNYIASRPFRVNAGPVHAYVAVPGGKTCYLSELKAGKEVIVVDQSGIQRTAVVGRVKIETRPLFIVHAKVDSEKESCYSILLQNAETVGLVPPTKGVGKEATAIPVTSLKVGDEVLLRLQGGARHTGGSTF